MNTKQRRILIVVAVFVVAMMLFPPFNISRSSDLVAGSWTQSPVYYFLIDPPGDARVNVALLLAQWIAVGIVGAIAFALSADKK